MLLYQCRYFNLRDETISRPSHLYNRNPHAWKDRSYIETGPRQVGPQPRWYGSAYFMDFYEIHNLDLVFIGFLYDQNCNFMFMTVKSLYICIIVIGKSAEGTSICNLYISLYKNISITIVTSSEVGTFHVIFHFMLLFHLINRREIHSICHRLGILTSFTSWYNARYIITWASCQIR